MELSEERIGMLTRRLRVLEQERKKGWDSHWKTLSEHFLPRRARFLDAGEETNKGDRKNYLEDSIGVMALRILANGMQSGLTSPARPWFSLTLQNRDLVESKAAKMWLNDTYEKMVGIFAKSNFYDQIHILYSELACFGTGVMIIEEDSRRILRCRALTAGEFCLDAGADGMVDTLYRRIRMTPRQVIEAWPDAAPESVRSMAARHADKWLTVLHAVFPNKEDEVRGSRRASERPYRSIYIIYDGARRSLLEDGGYYEFPALCPRWTVTASDVYGASPAMDALGDCAQLQKITLDSRTALEMEVNPPLGVFSTHPTGKVDRSPGAVNYFGTPSSGQTAVEPLTHARANLQGAQQEKLNLKDQIQRHFHNDLFLMISDVNKQMTATEVAERNAEKLLMLGPVLDRLRSELFQPLIERVYGIMDRAGLIAFPPEEIAAEEIKVEFISILAQAQKQAGIAALTQTVGFVAQLMQMNPDAGDRLNVDEAVDQWADMQGVPPSLIRGMDEVQELRAQRKQQQAIAMAMAQAQQGADIAKTGGEAMQAMRPPQDDEQAQALQGAM
ncbi:MAG: head-tail connector protein [Desulfovibrio sp.]|nr:head-tail connector protein [Desulfovibrio sp.]